MQSLVIIHPSWRRGRGIGENFGGELAVVAWETRRLLGRLASTSLYILRGFYNSVARVWIGS